jgi:hypothetical protein
MKKKLKPIPEFKTEAEEREFWESKENDTTEYFDMQNPVYRNLSMQDTLFGLDLFELVIMAALTNLVFRIHQPQVWSGKLLNGLIVAMSYLLIAGVKKMFPPGSFKNRVNFLFTRHRFRPEPEEILKSMHEVE